MSPAAPVTDRLRTRSLRGRVTLTVLAFVAAMLVVLAVVTDVALNARLEGELRQRLTDRADFALLLENQLDDEQLVERLEGDGISVVLTTADGQVVAQGPLRPAGTPSVAPELPGPPGPRGGPAADPVQRSGELLQVSERLDDGSTLVLLADAGEVRRTLDQVRTTLAAAGVGLLVLAALVLGPIVGRALRPLDQMTATARSITAGDRAARLRPDRPGTELGRTAVAFDAMLDEVASSEAQARGAEQRLRGFLSDAAHELRTPLAGVQAAAERLLVGTPDREQAEELSVTVIREARRAGRLVEDMLTMARIDSGLQLDTRRADLLELARRVADSARLRAPSARVEVAGGSLSAEVDPDRVQQVLTNLVDNALAAGGPHAHVRIEGRRDGDRVVLEVADDGPGVPPEQAERVFERLVRLDPARSGAGGSGLGLPIARGIARAHGGSLGLRQTDGPGAVFRLELPA